MVVRHIELETLSSSSFKDYGDVIDGASISSGSLINNGYTLRSSERSTVVSGDENGSAVITMFETKPIELPFRLNALERHPLSSQAFINIDNNPYIVVVAKPGDLELNEVRAFLARPDQGVNIGKGVWHHHNLCLNGTTRFVVIERSGPEDNFDEYLLQSEHSLLITK